MKLKGSAILLILVVAFTFLFLSAQWVNLSHRDSIIDRLSVLLEPVKYIETDTRIGFISNLPEGSPSTELYFQSQFAMAPVIIVPDAAAKLILVAEKQGQKKLSFPNTDTLWTGTTGDLNFYYLKHK